MSSLRSHAGQGVLADPEQSARDLSSCLDRLFLLAEANDVEVISPIELPHKSNSSLYYAPFFFAFRRAFGSER